MFTASLFLYNKILLLEYLIYFATYQYFLLQIFLPIK